MRPPSPFRRFISMLLAVLVLTTSVGVTVQRLTCRMSGHSTVAFSVAGRADSYGCPGVPATSVAKGNCCDLSIQLHKLMLPVHELVAKTPLPAPLPVVEAPAPNWLGAATELALAEQAPRWFAADSSPPPGGRLLLAFVCSLMV